MSVCDGRTQFFHQARFVHCMHIVAYTCTHYIHSLYETPEEKEKMKKKESIPYFFHFDVHMKMDGVINELLLLLLLHYYYYSIIN